MWGFLRKEKRLGGLSELSNYITIEHILISWECHLNPQPQIHANSVKVEFKKKFFFKVEFFKS